MSADKNLQPLKPIYKQIQIDAEHSQPIAAQLADQLTWFIASGQIGLGEKLPAVYDLADQLNINMHTVQAAYHIMKQAHLISIRPGRGSTVLGFHPSAFIRNLPELPTHTVGFIAPDLGGSFYQAIYQGIQEIASQNHFLLISCGSCENPRIAREQLGMLVSKNVDGLIVVSDYLADGKEADKTPLVDLQNCPVPITFIDRPDEAGLALVFDGRQAGFLATEHLIQHGHRKVGLIINDRRFPTYRDCFSGYVNALEQNQLVVDPARIVEVNGWCYKAGSEAVAKLLSQTSLPEALFIAEDCLAIGVIRELKDRGLRVPQDVAIVGMNNFDESAYSEPRITTVDTSARLLGIQAMEIIIRMIEGEKIEPRKIHVPLRLMIRESCGCKAA